MSRDQPGKARGRHPDVKAEDDDAVMMITLDEDGDEEAAACPGKSEQPKQFDKKLDRPAAADGEEADQWICMDCCVAAGPGCRSQHALMRPRAALRRMLDKMAADVARRMAGLVDRAVETVNLPDVEAVVKILNGAAAAVSYDLSAAGGSAKCQMSELNNAPGSAVAVLRLGLGLVAATGGLGDILDDGGGDVAVVDDHRSPCSCSAMDLTDAVGPLQSQEIEQVEHFNVKFEQSAAVKVEQRVKQFEPPAVNFKLPDLQSRQRDLLKQGLAIGGLMQFFQSHPLAVETPAKPLKQPEVHMQEPAMPPEQGALKCEKSLIEDFQSRPLAVETPAKPLKQPEVHLQEPAMPPEQGALKCEKSLVQFFQSRPVAFETPAKPLKQPEVHLQEPAMPPEQGASKFCQPAPQMVNRHAEQVEQPSSSGLTHTSGHASGHASARAPAGHGARSVGWCVAHNCGRKFATWDLYQQHCSKDHRTWRCAVCTIWFPGTAAREQHLRQAHSLRCEECGGMFATKGQRNGHLAMYHRLDAHRISPQARKACKKASRKRLQADKREAKGKCPSVKKENIPKASRRIHKHKSNKHT